MTELVEMTASAAAEPRIAILGTVEITGTGRTTSLAGTNLPALLSMLALDPGRPVPNDRIIDALWPRTDPTRARRSLISLVHQLNATLGAHLGSDKAIVSVKSVGRTLRADPAMIDVVQFERRLAAAAEHVAAGRLNEAVDSVRGCARSVARRPVRWCRPAVLRRGIGSAAHRPASRRDGADRGVAPRRPWRRVGAVG